MPLLSRTRAIFLRAEFGFLGVMVVTLTHTPRLNGAPIGKSFRLRRMVSSTDWSTGDLVFLTLGLRTLRTSCRIVGIKKRVSNLPAGRPRHRRGGGGGRRGRAGGVFWGDPPPTPPP